MTPIEHTAEGYVIDAEMLGGAFQIDPSVIPELMRSGKITAHHERGVDSDSGLHCLVFSYSGRRFRVTINDNCQIVAQGVFRSIIGPSHSKI